MRLFSRPLTAIGLFIGLAAALGLACQRGPRDEPSSDDDGAPAQAATPRAFREQAHADAYRRALPKAERALALANPIAAGELGRAPVASLALDPGSRTALKTAVDEAWQAADGIEGDLISPEARVILLLARFGLSRARDLERRPPWRTDPSWTTAYVRRAFDALADDVLHGSASDPSTSLRALASTLEHGLADLGGTAPATVSTALADLSALEQRLPQLLKWSPPDKPIDPDSLAPLHQAITRAEQRLTIVQQSLGSAGQARYGTLEAADQPEAVKQLPARLGEAELTRRLGTEESVYRPARELFDQLGPTLERLRHMKAKRNAEGDDNPRAVDMARCHAVAARLEALRAAQPALAKATLDCGAAVRRWTGHGMTDAQLVVAAVDRGVIAPLRAARRDDEPPTIALVAGTVAPVSQRHTQRLAVLAAMGDDAALELALDEAIGEACLAATALWVHAELGDDASLEPRLAAYCPQKPAEAWVEAALASPRGALGGLLLWRLGRGPADVVALDRYWWAPAGLVDPLARPQTLDPPPPKPTGARILEGKAIFDPADADAQDE